MKIEIFSKAMDEIKDKYINEAMEYKKVRDYWFIKFIAAVVGLFLLVAVVDDTLSRMEIGGKACSASIGDMVNGTYYYHVRGDGLYSYSDDEGLQKIMSTYWYDSYEVNEYGIYYDRGRSLYVREHETGESRRLFRAGLFDSSYIGFTIQADGNVIVTIYNKLRDYQYELLLDGKTGEVLETVMEKEELYLGGLYYSKSHYLVGEREINMIETGNDYGGYLLQENGTFILPEGAEVERYQVNYIGDCLWFYVNGMADVTGEEQMMFVVRPDGNDEIKTLPCFALYSGTNDYLFWTESKTGTMWCFEVATGESWTLEVDSDVSLYAVVSDGEYVYSCTPMDDYHAKWELIYNESGQPVKLQLLDADIRD